MDRELGMKKFSSLGTRYSPGEHLMSLI